MTLVGAIASIPWR